MSKAVVVLLLEGYPFGSDQDHPILEWEWEETVRTQDRGFYAIQKVTPIAAFTEANLVRFIEFLSSVPEGGEKKSEV